MCVPVEQSITVNEEKEKVEKVEKVLSNARQSLCLLRMENCTLAFRSLLKEIPLQQRIVSIISHTAIRRMSSRH